MTGSWVPTSEPGGDGNVRGTSGDAIAPWEETANRLFLDYQRITLGTWVGLKTASGLATTSDEVFQCPLYLGATSGGRRRKAFRIALKVSGVHSPSPNDLDDLNEHFTEKSVVEIGKLCAEFLVCRPMG